MHWRWAVILRPWARNSALSSSGDRMASGHAITNHCFLTTVVEISHSALAAPRHLWPCGRRVPCSRLWQAGPVPPARASAPAGRGNFDRAEALRRLGDESFDVLVIGGGITGAGVALDAASRGLRTALVERDDFASGTSSKSSKMVHGGLRYLQQRDFRLVYEALHERQRLLENAPHLVAPLPFLIPLFGRDGVVNKGVARTYSTRPHASTTSPAGCASASATGGSPGPRRWRTCPTLRTDRLVAGFIYYDARADDARLTLAVARTAALDHGAVLANYTEVVGLVTDASGAVQGARVRPAVPVGAGATARR